MPCVRAAGTVVDYSGHPIVSFRFAALRILLALLTFARMASAEVTGIDVRSRADFGTHERVIARVHYAVDPKLPANQRIADLAFAPKNPDGRVDFVGDLLLFLPKQSASARGAVFLEVVNRGRDQSLGLMSDARQRDLAPENWNLGDRFLLEQGFTVAFLGWQFDVQPGDGLSLTVPSAPVSGLVRASAVTVSRSGPGSAMGLAYCAADAAQRDATLTHRSVIDGPAQVLPRDSWEFAPDGCSVRRAAGFDAGLNEVIYRASGSPVAGLGLAAVRDFASYLKHGGAVTTLRENPASMQRVIGFGYSQSGRFLREFVRDGFNQDERGRAAFDGLMIASAGAGGGSFNHRFASPGQAGNSVLSIFRPVDLPPFTDDGLLARAAAASVVPRIFYTFSSTEYWARAGSLTHTNESGTADVPLAQTSRLVLPRGHAARLGRPAAGATADSPRAQLRRPEVGPSRAARRSRHMAACRHRASAVALPHHRASPTGATRGRALPASPVAPVCRLHAGRVAHGLRRRVRDDESDYQGTSVARRAVQRARAPGRRRRQRRGRHRAAGSGGSPRDAHRLERVHIPAERAALPGRPRRLVPAVCANEGRAGAVR